MAKNTKAAKKKVTELLEAKKLQEEAIIIAELEVKEAEEEEQKHYDDTVKSITDMATKGGFKCGVLLAPEDVVQIVNVALNTMEKIYIPFRLYYLENEDLTEKT